MTTFAAATAIPRPFDPTQWKAGLSKIGGGASDNRGEPISQIRGNKWFNVLDYGAVGDGVADDTVAIQAAFTAACTGPLNIVYFPQGDYLVTATIDIPFRCRIIGEGRGTDLGGGTRIMFDSATTPDTLFTLIKNTVPYHYDFGAENISFVSKNPATVNQDCFQLGDGTTRAEVNETYFRRCAWVGFSGVVFRITHVNLVSTTFAFSSGMFDSCIFENIGGFSVIVNTGIGDLVIGTGVTFINTHVKNTGWNEASPQPYLFDFEAIREIAMYETVTEGAGPTASPQTAIIRCSGEGYYLFDGWHYEFVNDDPTNFIEFTNTINPNGPTHCKIRGGRFTFLNGMKIKVANNLKLTLEGVDISGSHADSVSLIDEANSDVGSWQVDIKDCSASGAFDVADKHIGRVRISGIGGGSQGITYRDSANVLLDYQPGKHGMLCGLVSDVSNTKYFGNQFCRFFLDSTGGITFEERGIVDDPTEGRVFAFRGIGSFPRFKLDWELPASYWAGVGLFGAQIWAAMRWRYIHQEAVNQRFMWNGNISGATQNVFGYNADIADVDKDTWYSGAWTAILKGAGTLVTAAPSSSDAITLPWEFRIASLAMGLGSELPMKRGGGGLISATANQMTPLLWYDDGDPDWGDYKDGDTWLHVAPAVGTKRGGICTTAGALATAWAATTAYNIGDWVENDTPNRIYICTVAGTSAGSGGPTGVTAGIIDGTVTWDFHAAQATFTALANV